MRIFKLKVCPLVYLPFFLFLLPFHLSSQEDFIAANTYFNAFTEEIPDEPIFEANYIPGESFRVQLGLFGNPDNVEKLIEIVEAHFDLPLYIFLEDRNQKQLYRILVGDFYSKTAAKDFIPSLKEKGMKGIIKRFARWEDSI